MLELKHWRDSANAYKRDPKSCDPDDRIRMEIMLVTGDETALYRKMGSSAPDVDLKDPGKHKLL
jgi:hypothetical protein